MVFFLHPVDQVRGGKVAKVEPLKNTVGIISLLLLALLLGLGVLIYLFFDLEADPIQPEPVSPIEASSTTNEQEGYWEEWEGSTTNEQEGHWEEWEVTTTTTPPPPTTTTTTTETSTMNEPVTTGSTEVTSEKPGENKSSTESGKIV